MDSFFKAAVCDLDKLLDDFELNTGKSYINLLINLPIVSHVIIWSVKCHEKKRKASNPHF